MRVALPLLLHVSFTETLSLELAADASQVKVFLVCPGAVRTPFNADSRRVGSARTSQSLWLEPSDVADRILKAIDGEAFYVYTHADSRQRLQQYLQRVIASCVD